MYVYSKSVLSTYLLKKNVYFYIEKKNKITKKKKKKKGDFKNSNYNISFKKILRFSIDDWGSKVNKIILIQTGGFSLHKSNF